MRKTGQKKPEGKDAANGPENPLQLVTGPHGPETGFEAYYARALFVAGAGAERLAQLFRGGAQALIRQSG